MSARVIPLRPLGARATELSDEALIAACANGDATALTALYRRHQAPISRFASRLLGGRAAEVEDVVQQVFLLAWRDAARFRAASSVRGWLFGIAANVARRHHRGEARRGFAFMRLSWFTATTTPPIDEAIVRKQLVDRLGAALDALPHDLRVAYVMCEIEDLPGVEAARILGVRPGTLWRRLHDARKRLRAAIEGAQP